MNTLPLRSLGEDPSFAPEPAGAEPPSLAAARPGAPDNVVALPLVRPQADGSPTEASAPRPAPRAVAAARAAQRMLRRLDGWLPGAEAPDLPPMPVFVTGLPGGGATRAFDMLAGGGHYAAFRSGDGAFAGAPRLGRAVRRMLRRPPGAPAAFDEAARLAAGGDPDRHRAILAELCAEDGGKRYIGKNAGLMARLPEVFAAFEDARVVVAFREPGAQLTRMDIAGEAGRADWLRYWIKAYRRAAEVDGIVLVDADRLDAEGRPILRRLAQATNTPETPGFLAQVAGPGRIARRAAASSADSGAPPLLMAEARALHWRLARAAI